MIENRLHRKTETFGISDHKVSHFSSIFQTGTTRSADFSFTGAEDIQERLGDAAGEEVGVEGKP